ncbi:hypothetical protein [Pseudomonas inefficax]|uniref:Uncharacterized protein n=1 Tax=Pseudomonas inefficax TaxID=2078786 RepID=A0AAQ1P4G9_9PSED|nr:hypothetical protein [Pseudomonas inefficax]SPO59721.1 conserved protein of unknown function [Pseudomonas inefficax]
MSLENEVAGLASVCNKLVDTVNGRMAGINAAVAAAVAAAPLMVRGYWVDPQLGDDANGLGTEASPFKTVQRAVDATPDCGRVTVWLAKDYVLDRSITTNGRQVVIGALPGSGRRLILNEFTPEGDTLPRMGSFWMSGGSNLQLLNVTLSLPASSAGDLSAYYALCFASGSSAPIIMQVRMYNCAFELRGTFRGKLIGPGSALFALSMTGTAVPSALNGSLIVGVAAGTLSKDLGHIITNLSSL